MNKINEVTGRDYKPFNYYGADDAEHVVVAMGSVTETLEETVDYLMEKGEKAGVIKSSPISAVCIKILHGRASENS